MKIDKYGIAHFYDGGEGGGGDPSGGSDPGGGGGGSDPGGGPGGSDLSSENFSDYSYDAGPGPGGTDVRDQISSVFGGTGPGLNIAGPMSPEDPEVLADYASGRIGYNWSSPLGREARSILDQLEDMGYGKMEGINPRNPSQTVDNLIASSRTNWAIENLGIPALMSAVPGANTVMALTRGIGGLLSGKVSPGQTIANTAIGIASSKLGVPAGTFTAMINGNMGQAAANTAMGAVNQAVSNLTGIPSGLINTAMNATGIGAQANQAIAGAVNQGLGITPSNNVAAIGSAIDQAIGATPGRGLSFNFDSSGQYAPSFSDSGGGSDAGGISGLVPGMGGTKSIPKPVSQSGINAPAALAALSGLGGEEDESEPYQTSQVTARSPFGVMYGMDRATMPYGMRG